MYKVRCLVPLQHTWLLRSSARTEQVYTKVSHSPSPSPGCCAARLEQNRWTKSGVSHPFSAPGCYAAQRKRVYSQVSHSPSPSPGSGAGQLEQNRCTKSGVSHPFSTPGCYAAQLKQVYKVRCLAPLQCTWLLCSSTRTGVQSGVLHPFSAPGCYAAQLKQVYSQVSCTPSVHLAVLQLN